MHKATTFVIAVGVATAILPSAVEGQTGLRRPGFDPSARPPSTLESVTALLHSASAREQAWGAWLASTGVLPQLAPLLQQVVELRALDGSLGGRAAFDVAVDALIQLNARVPEALVRIVHERSEPAAIILASLNRPAMTEYLLEVADRGKEDVWFGAANLLMQSRTIYAEPRGFAAVLLRPLSIQLEIHVVDKDDAGIRGGSGGGVGIGCGAAGSAPGLPPWPTYSLTTYAHPGYVVHATGPTPTYYRRVVAPAGSTPVGSVRTRNLPQTDDRLRYLAVLARLEDQTMPLRAVEWHSVKWQGDVPLAQAIQRLRGEVVGKHAHLLHLLQQYRALTEDEAASLPPLTINVTVRDLRAVK